MLDYTLKIGLASCRRWLPGKRTGIFNPDYARANKKQVEDWVRLNWLPKKFLNFCKTSKMSCRSPTCSSPTTWQR